MSPAKRGVLPGSGIRRPDGRPRLTFLLPPRRSKSPEAADRVASGNFLEMNDFQIFGYYAAAIAGTFFPSNNEYASLMASLATFGAGFLMRPLGAVFLGACVDHRGRRAGLLLTLGLMAVGTLSIAVTPSYASIGLLAPLLVLAGRLIHIRTVIEERARDIHVVLRHGEH
jgi:MFS family permease